MKSEGVYQKYKKYILLAGSFLFAFFGLDAFPQILKFWLDWKVISNSIVAVLLFGLFSFLIYKTLSHPKNRRLIVFCLVFGILLSAALAVGSSVYLIDHTEINRLKTYLAILKFTPVSACALAQIFFAADRMSQKPYVPVLKMNQDFLASKKFLLLLWGAIFLLWIPVFLASYPGVYGYDCIYQMKQFETGLSGHHPIAHTLLMGGLTLLGDKLFGSYQTGFAIYSVLQMLIMSLIFAYICHYLAKIKAPVSLQAASWIFFAFLPFNPLFAVSGTKDVLFSGFFALAAVLVFDAVRAPGEFFTSWKKQLAFCAAFFLVFAFRNNGFYAFLVFAPFFVIVLRKYWKRALVLILICVVCNQLYFGPLHSALGVIKGDSREALSVPIQQLSRVMRDNYEELTEEERSWIEQLIPAYSSYQPRISDLPKRSFNTDFLKQDLFGNFIKWIKIGLKCPLTYIDAFFSLNLGFWYPDMIYRDPGAWHPYIEYDMLSEEIAGSPDFLYIERDSKLPWLSERLERFAYETPHQDTPVLSMLYSPGFMFWMLALYMLMCLYYKKYKLLLPGFFGLGLWVTLMFSPVVLLRYAYPLFLIFPVEIGTMLTELRKRPERADPLESAPAFPEEVKSTHKESASASQP